MSFVSLEFILFVIISLAIYYVLPQKHRWIALLILSYTFYAIGGKSTIVYLIFTTLITFASGILLDNLNKKEKDSNAQKDKIKKKKKLIVAVTSIVTFSMLFYFKYWNFFAEAFNGAITSASLPVFDLILPLGISFYIFQSIGYIIDVYRKKYEAERNVFKFALFVSYFPQIVQGPINRFNDLKDKLLVGNKFSFDNLKSGIELAMLGYFKKLIIADRAAVIANEVFTNYSKYNGAIILFGVILYSIQLYCDFSGGIEIARGVSKMFGIDIALNFKRPMFATSLADFWRRWHISLGTWMKDYLFYPLSLSKPFIKLGKKIREKLSGKAGKIIPVSIVTFIVYFVIGIWHGASFKYIVYGIWNGTIISASLLLKDVFNNIKLKLKIKPENKLYKLFQTIRTNIIVLFGRYITRAGRFLVSVEMLKLTFTTFDFNSLVDGSLLNLGLELKDLIVILVGCIFLFIIEFIEEKGKSVSIILSKKNVFIQWSCLIAFLIVLAIFGIYRGDYIASEFIYKQF